jgi:hypothetical protein
MKQAVSKAGCLRKREIIYKPEGPWSQPTGSNQPISKQGACCLLRVCFLFGLLFDPEHGDDMFLRNVRLTFNELHGVISITTAVRTTNPT